MTRKNILKMPLKDVMNTLTLEELCETMADYFRENNVIAEDIHVRNLDINDISKLIGVSRSTVRRMIADGILPDGTTKIGGGGRKLWSYKSIQHLILQKQKERSEQKQ